VIVVDTSVWVAALRDAASSQAKVLQQLLDADEVAIAIPVRIELLSGASRRDRPRLRRALSALPLLYPTDDTWTMLDRWLDRAGEAGERFGFGDLLIGALAVESGALMWSLDADFARMERLKLVEVYEPSEL
jgi:predicted nucleic acid-binding protein